MKESQTHSEVVVAVEGHDDEDLIFVSEGGDDLGDVGASSIKGLKRREEERSDQPRVLFSSSSIVSGTSRTKEVKKRNEPQILQDRNLVLYPRWTRGDVDPLDSDVDLGLDLPSHHRRRTSAVVVRFGGRSEPEGVVVVGVFEVDGFVDG